jgi:hypothetical protein
VANGPVQAVAQVNSALFAPFRKQIPLGTLALVLALALVASGMWKLVLDRVDRTVREL